MSVKGMIVKRLAAGVVTIFMVSILIFLSIEALPGDPATAILGQQATPENLEALRKELKLDLPPHIRYWSWLVDFVQGDLGNSLSNKRPVNEVIGWRFSNTLFLALQLWFQFLWQLFLVCWRLYTVNDGLTGFYPWEAWPPFLFLNFLWDISLSIFFPLSWGFCPVWPRFMTACLSGAKFISSYCPVSPFYWW